MGLPTFDIRARRRADGHDQSQRHAGKGVRRTNRVACQSRTYEVLIDEEGDKLVDEDKIVREAIDVVEQNGIVFLDELDKICARPNATARMSAAKACSAICCP